MTASLTSSGKRALSPTGVEPEPKSKRGATSKSTAKTVPKKAGPKKSAAKKGSKGKAAAKSSTSEPVINENVESDHDASVGTEPIVEAIQSTSPVNEPLNPGLFYLFAQGVAEYNQAYLPECQDATVPEWESLYRALRNAVSTPDYTIAFTVGQNSGGDGSDEEEEEAVSMPPSFDPFSGRALQAGIHFGRLQCKPPITERTKADFAALAVSLRSDRSLSFDEDELGVFWDSEAMAPDGVGIKSKLTMPGEHQCMISASGVFKMRRAWEGGSGNEKMEVFEGYLKYCRVDERMKRKGVDASEEHEDSFWAIRPLRVL